MKDWFSANKDGLRQIAERLVERRGFGIVGAELYQNVMDTNATTCIMTIEKLANKPQAMLTVEDNDPTGFVDLSHAWTVFAPSQKKEDPTKAGRFNLGEKVVLSFCREATIHTTSGMVVFNEEGRTDYPRRKRERGTSFEAVIDCTADRFQQYLDYMKRLIVKEGLTLAVNGEIISHRHPIASFEETLATEVGPDLRPSKRRCEVRIYEVLPGETAMLYELGIPVVETGDKWHYSVMQKVPLNVDRDNVTPAYLRDLRTFVFNNMHNQITPDDTIESWVNEATSDEKCLPEAAEDFRVKKYGEKSVALDPTNPEANATAMANGYTVIPSKGLTRGQRDNLAKGSFLLSSTKMFPDAGKGAYSDDPNAIPVQPISEEKLTEGMKLIREYTMGLAEKLLSKKIHVLFVNVPITTGQSWAACYGRAWALGKSEFHYNVTRLGKAWFANGVKPSVDELIIHEFGHEYESNHLSDGYYKALCKLGARLKQVALNEQHWFMRFATTV